MRACDKLHSLSNFSIGGMVHFSFWSMATKFHSRIYWAGLCAALLAGCGSLFAPPTATPVPTPTPIEYLGRAAKVFEGLQSVQFKLQHTGEPVVLDKQLGAKFLEAAGAYQAPGQLFAQVKVEAMGSLFTLKMLWRPEGALMTNPITGMYGPQPAGMPLAPLALFDTATGISHLLAAEIQNLQIAGIEEVEGAQLRHFTGDVSALALKTILPGTLADANLKIDLWVQVDNDRLARIQVTAAGSETQLEFFGHNEPVEIPVPK